ncbi:MAG: class I SAM-dependent methyltransferase [Chloroflexi bacterium]|nr:class I SAM-dependent methyltransferase [Chloroflexota bacterium]
MTREQGHRWFAAFYERMMNGAEKSFMRDVRLDVAGGARGSVLEIGCGPGFNFRYYGDGVTELIATDPDPFMLERARKRAAEVERAIRIEQARAEELPFEDSVFDTVVSTLNFCTIADPAKALTEVKRVLKPESQYRFYDHVRYDHAFGAFWQDLATPVWRWLGAGCHPNRDVAGLVQAAGFRIERLERHKPYPPIPPMAFTRPHILGVAVPG